MFRLLPKGKSPGRFFRSSRENHHRAGLVQVALPTLALMVSLWVPAMAGAVPSLYGAGVPQAGAPLSAPLSTRAQTPEEVLREGIGKLMYFLKGTGARPPSAPLQHGMKKLLEQEAARYFAFPYMARWAAGKRYRRMNDSGKAAMAGRLKGMLIDAMLRHLSDYQDTGLEAGIEYMAPRRNKLGGIVLGVYITGKDGGGRRLEFHMFRADRPSKLEKRAVGDKDWKIVDVVADGQSALAYYRWYFSRMPRTGNSFRLDGR